MFMIDLDVPPCMKGGGNRNSRGVTTIVYALADPRNGTVRSVGVTNSPIGRLNEHMRMYGGNERKNVWLRELVDAYMLPLMYTLEVLEIEGIWRDREIAWIEAYVASGADLLNDEVSKLKRKREEERMRRLKRR
jgi:hypothetical protein